ncbi:MAG: GAF domain-containing protein [Acidobacteriia bacterium]|nr:GAF domain-containing protein [Terriglobia bacterium]
MRDADCTDFLRGPRLVVGEESGGHSEVPSEIGFCSHTIRGEGLLEVPDTLLDERLRDSPLVTGEPGIRSYAGAPIRTPEGLAVGALCLIDRVPRVLTDEQRRNLASLCRGLERQLVRHSCGQGRVWPRARDYRF